MNISSFSNTSHYGLTTSSPWKYGTEFTPINPIQHCCLPEVVYNWYDLRPVVVTPRLRPVRYRTTRSANRSAVNRILLHRVATKPVPAACSQPNALLLFFYFLSRPVSPLRLLKIYKVIRLTRPHQFFGKFQWFLKKIVLKIDIGISNLIKNIYFLFL